MIFQIQTIYYKINLNWNRIIIAMWTTKCIRLKIKIYKFKMK